MVERVTGEFEMAEILLAKNVQSSKTIDWSLARSWLTVAFKLNFILPIWYVIQCSHNHDTFMFFLRVTVLV